MSVAAPSDDVYVDAGNVSATITAATGGGFEALAVNPAAATTAVTDTIQTTTVSLTASASVAEGGTIVYTASLNNVAQTPVTVTLSNGATITIAAGASSGSANVAAPGDDVYVDAGSVSATITAATGGNFEALAINSARRDHRNHRHRRCDDRQPDRDTERRRGRHDRLHRIADQRGAVAGDA